MSKLSLRRLLSPKPLALIAAAVLLVSFVPLISSALTVDELLGQGGGTTTTSTYPSITVTSSSNTSLLLKVTPVSFNGTNWTYQITWHRTLNAQGSVYVTLKSDKSQQIYSQSPAGQNDDGSQIISLSPSTAYRIEFWQQPAQGGILLLRKFFTTLPATAATTGSTATTSGNSQNNFAAGSFKVTTTDGTSAPFIMKKYPYSYQGGTATQTFFWKNQPFLISTGSAVPDPKYCFSTPHLPSVKDVYSQEVATVNDYFASNSASAGKPLQIAQVYSNLRQSTYYCADLSGAPSSVEPGYCALYGGRTLCVVSSDSRTYTDLGYLDVTKLPADEAALFAPSLANFDVSTVGAPTGIQYLNQLGRSSGPTVNSPSVQDQLTSNPTGPANCFSPNISTIIQDYSTKISSILNTYYTQKYGSGYATKGTGLLNDNDINWVSLGCTSGDGGNLAYSADAIMRKGNSSDYKGNAAVTQFYCGPANYKSPGFVNGSNLSAFANTPPSDSLCSNGASPTDVVLNLSLPQTASNNQGDLGTPGVVHWHWGCTGAAKPDIATKESDYTAAGFSHQYYADSFDNRNGTYSQCAAPVLILDGKYCGTDQGQDFGSSDLPTQGLCANGGKPSQVYFRHATDYGTAQWVCSGSDYASYCTAKIAAGTTDNGLSSTAAIPDPVCSYDPAGQKTECLTKTATCLDSGTCNMSMPITSINDYTIPPAPAITSSNSCPVGVGGVGVCTGGLR